MLRTKIILQRFMARDREIINQLVPKEKQVSDDSYFATNFWIFTMWLMIFQLLRKMDFGESFSKNFETDYGRDDSNVRKFFLARMLARISSHIGRDSLRKLIEQETFRQHFRVIFAMELCVKPFVQG